MDAGATKLLFTKKRGLLGGRFRRTLRTATLGHEPSLKKMGNVAFERLVPTAQQNSVPQHSAAKYLDECIYNTVRFLALVRRDNTRFARIRPRIMGEYTSTQPSGVHGLGSDWAVLIRF